MWLKLHFIKEVCNLKQSTPDTVHHRGNVSPGTFLCGTSE